MAISEAMIPFSVVCLLVAALFAVIVAAFYRTGKREDATRMLKIGIVLAAGGFAVPVLRGFIAVGSAMGATGELLSLGAFVATPPASLVIAGVYSVVVGIIAYYVMKLLDWPPVRNETAGHTRNRTHP